MYRIEGKTLIGVSYRVLESAVPPLSEGDDEPVGSFGWIGGACEAPNRGDRYVVEFLGKRDFRILAYVDRYGRAFTTDVPVTMPPARTPDLDFARFSEQPLEDEERGCVEVFDDSDKRQVAQYVFRRGRYTLFDSWFNFGGLGEDLVYDDVMARAYFAFVYRPAHGGAPVPARGMEKSVSGLRDGRLMPALRGVVSIVDQAERDPALRPPALLSCLSRWLDEAGFKQIDARGVPDNALRLVRAKRYSDTFYISAGNETKIVSTREIWALEGALNRFLLVGEALGEKCEGASERDCARMDDKIFETAPNGAVTCNLGCSMPAGAPGGEWETRAAICAGVERIRIPVRMDMSLRLDVEAGVAAFLLTVPDAGLMPASHWEDADVTKDGLAGLTKSFRPQREAQARRYAMRLGIAVASAVFEAAPGIKQVDVTARPLDAALGEEGADGQAPKTYYHVSFDRELFEDVVAVGVARSSDPRAFFERAGAIFDPADVDPFASVRELDSARLRRLSPESVDVSVPTSCIEDLGAFSTVDLRIDYEAYRRRIGERLADRIVSCDGALDAIRVAREEEEAAEARGDDKTAEACTRLMAALAEGTVDMKDQNDVVGRFLGDDRCLVALGQAHKLGEEDSKAAVDLLADAIAEAAALDGFVDGNRTVYRCFDSYASRVLYNQSLVQAYGRVTPHFPEGVVNLRTVAASDVGRDVQMCPDSFYLCHLEIVRLLERSFERAEDALRYGRRAIEIAPSTAAGYRQLGRAYMLVGDMGSAASVLKDGLSVALQPNDVAVLYYQLAYVLWKAGDADAATACYMKSLKVSPVVALQATAELQELVGETKTSLPAREEVDAALVEQHIPVAPTDDTLDALERGAVAATDAGAFAVARNLLALRLRYRTDDALVSVLQSLEDPPAR